MPLKRCVAKGKKGWKWGDEGFCYTYNNDKEEKLAKNKAMKQAAAIEKFGQEKK